MLDRYLPYNMRPFFIPGLPTGDINRYFGRHCESYANKYEHLYGDIPDFIIPPTPLGIEQAKELGDFFADRLFKQYQQEGARRFGKIRVWYSPSNRTVITAYHVLRKLAEKFPPDSGIVTYDEEPFLIEQRGGPFSGHKGNIAEIDPKTAQEFRKHKAYHGNFFVNIPGGEGQLDALVRLRPTFETSIRKYERQNIRHDISICHGAITKLGTMSWMRYPAIWMAAEKTPGNCWVRHIQGNRYDGYTDFGYIHGRGAPLRDIRATQRELTVRVSSLEHEKPSTRPRIDLRELPTLYPVILEPRRPRTKIAIPKGVVVLNPYAKEEFVL